MTEKQEKPKKNLAKPIMGLILLIGVTALLIVGLGRLGEDSFEKDPDKPLIIATVPHIAIWTQKLVGDSAQVELLVGGGVDVHDFSFAPSDFEKVALADLVVANGAGLEPWLGILKKQFPEKVIFESAADLALRPGDPHTWVDPVLAQEQIAAIAATINEELPDISATVTVAVSSYAQELQNLDKQIRSALQEVPNKSFIAFHESFNYFADRYGLEQVTQLVERPGDQLTLNEVNNVGELSSSLGIKTLFIEPGPIPDLASVLAEEFNLELVVLDPMETAKVNDGEYINVMQKNLEALTTGL